MMNHGISLGTNLTPKSFPYITEKVVATKLHYYTCISTPTISLTYNLLATTFSLVLLIAQYVAPTSLYYYWLCIRL